LSGLLQRRRLVAAIILVLLAIVATESVVLAATVRQGSVEYLKVATETQLASTSSTSWTDVPGTALAMPIPSGEHDFFLIIFTASAPQCFKSPSPASTASCEVRAVVDGQVASPGPFQVGMSDATLRGDYSDTLQWASTVLAPGPHYVKIQYWVDASQNQLDLFQRTTTVIRAKAS
jgi:hypothetical protein